MRLVDQINNYIQEKKPWETAKNIENISKTEILLLHSVLSLALSALVRYHSIKTCNSNYV